MRYGNKAFRAWHQRLVDDGPALLSTMLLAELNPAAVELQGYLVGSFGGRRLALHESWFPYFLEHWVPSQYGWFRFSAAWKD